MGKRVHVIKKMAEYGSEGFNWKQQEFKQLLDALGCDTNGEDYADSFECTAESFKKAIALLKEYHEEGRSEKVIKKFDDEYLDIDDVDDCIKSLDESLDYIIYTMEWFYKTRDKSADYIMFECW